MLSPALAGLRLKIDRAHAHFVDLQTMIHGRFSPPQKGKSIRPLTEVNYERNQVILRHPAVDPLDPTLPLIIGDCIHNLRSALDHLVLQLAVLKGFGAEAETKTAFPVCRTDGEFDEFVRRKIGPFVGDTALTKLKELQPHKTTDSPESDILWLLSQLDIIDKHRLLVVGSQQFKPISFDITIPSGERLARPINDAKWKPSIEGAEILTVEFGEISGEVNMNVETAIAVQFANTKLACDGWIVQDFLEQCGMIVGSIVNDFGTTFFGESE